MKKNIYIVLGTKGGTGKTIFSCMVMPILFAMDEKVTVYSIDNNNNIGIESNFVMFKTLRTCDAEDVIDDVELKSLVNSDEISIIDAGGGEDTHILLRVIKKSNIDDMTFIIPLNDDMDQIKNLIDTIKIIKESTSNARILVVLNKVNVMSKDKIQEQFVGIYGNSRYGINALDNEVIEQIDDFYFLENSPLFSIIKNEYRTTLQDSFIEAEELLQNLEEKKREWAEKGSEYFMKQNAKVRLANDVLSLTKRIYKMKTMLED